MADLWQKVSLDVSPYKIYQFFIITYYDLSGKVQAKSLYILFYLIMVEFFWEDVICCHNYFWKLIIIRGSEKKDVIVELAKKYEIKRVIVFIYHF